eukprot:586804-Amphidinium_carterae.1
MPSPFAVIHTLQARPVVKFRYGEYHGNSPFMLNPLVRPGVIFEPPLSVPDSSWLGQKVWSQTLTSRQDRRPAHPPLFPVVDALARPG